jgi:hypothetical protein
MTLARWVGPAIVGLVTLASTPASAAEPKSGSKSDSRSDSKDEAAEDESGPKIPVLKETEPSTPKGNPWADAGLSKRKDGQNVASSGSTRTDFSGRPLDPRPASVGLLVGYATENLNLGLGIRAGYSLFERLYLGGAFMFHFGRSVGDATVRVFYPSVEIGYDLHLALITLRPYVGAALTVVKGSVGQLSASEESFSVYPGLQLDFEIPSTPGFVGIDGRYLIPTGTDSFEASLGVFLTVGARF